MKLIDRIKARTPKKDKEKGIASTIVTIVGTTAAAAIGLGIITIATPAAFLAATVVSLVFGAKSLYHAQKVDKDEPK